MILGQVGNQNVKENADLVKETLDVLYDDVLPKSSLLDNI